MNSGPLNDSRGAQLLAAVKAGNIGDARIMLDAGANPSVADAFGKSALGWAAGDGKFELTQLLIARGAKLDAANESGLTPLIFAAMNKQADTAQALIEAGANVNAAGKGTWYGGVTALMYMASNRDAEMVALLIAAGASPHVSDRHRRNADYYSQRFPEIQEILRMTPKEAKAWRDARRVERNTVLQEKMPAMKTLRLRP